MTEGTDSREQLLLVALTRLKNELQVASSRGRPVSVAWLDRRIAYAREVLTIVQPAKGEGEGNDDDGVVLLDSRCEWCQAEAQQCERHAY